MIPKTKNECNFVFNHSFLSYKIEYLERKNLSLLDQMITYDYIGKNLNAEYLIQKWNCIIQKNGDLIRFLEAYTNIKKNKLDCYRYAPLTSVNVERSFSIYKNIYRENRRSLKPETIFCLMLIKINSKRL